MLTLQKLRDNALEMQISQMGKDNRYNFNENYIGFVDGVKIFIIPNVDVYREFIEEKGYVYDAHIYIPSEL